MDDKIQVYMISNTHWDREWYMPLEKYMIRLVKLMDRLIGVMEKDPRYCFVTDGQYVLVEDYLKAKPYMEERVKKLIAENRLKIGPWYTQPLETMITGEAMIRNLYYGITESEKLGDAMLFGYMIDEFGHASQTPQILKGFGITDAMAWRGIENKAKDVFEWEAPNGDIVFMHRSVHGYGEATALPEGMDNFKENVGGRVFERQGLSERVRRLKSLKDGFSQAGVQFWLNGIDHSWAQENIFEIIDVINKEFPEYGVRQTTLEEYAECARAAYKDKKIVMQKYTGELMHPDEQILVCTHSTRPDQKQKHYFAERLLEKCAEPMAAIAWLTGGEYPLWALRDSWKYILENHAHDSLGGCSVDEVYERVMTRYVSSISLSGQIADDAFAYLMSMCGGENMLYVFNTNSSAYDGLITGSFDMPDALLPDDFDIADKATGEILDFEILNTEMVNTVKYNAFYGHPSRIPGKSYRIALDAGKIGGFSMKSFQLRAKGPRTGSTPKDIPEHPPGAHTLENEFYHVEIKQNGCIDVLDKRSGAKYPGLLQIADSGDCGNLWVHSAPENNTVISNENVYADIRKLKENKFITEYEIKYSLDIPEGYDYQSKSRSRETCAMDVAVKISLLHKTKYIKAEIELDNKSRYHQVRVLLPSGIANAQTSLGGQPFDVVGRKIGIPDGFDFNKDKNCEYHPMQDFCAVTDGDRGLMAAAKGIFEYEAINDGQKTLALTLLRSTKFDMASDDRAGGYNMEKSYMMTKIKHEIAIMPFDGDWRDVYPYVLDYINPPRISFGREPDEAVLPGYAKPAKSISADMEFIRTEGKNVYITAVKREENGGNLLIRIISFADDKQNISVSVNDIITCKKCWYYSLKETKMGYIASGNTAKFDIMPKQLITIGFEI
ncbi:MAG: hypothetical protein FWD23_06600 [Oscillospiraceae bacterium]|nr:hypothetical protein [Oscillospiraceae bacterium]